ncbi:FtsK/SpoIIIE domain-containing protein [Brachybacterium sacelli]|uniref:FtsK domain-containing protein n=1 Tax=Brachybacterium sacelli TaxID=173364 RepID=A0ABS4X5V1_9MICO|nr:FtsK/SpoIIIE domain-containing protein [Brachybacterium sacelli]MBP2383746.1 hypothetical protein [Brachybacterium sacelli]
MSQKYNKPSPNFTGTLLVLTVVAAGATLVVGLPAGWVAFAGVLVTAWCHPAPMLTGPKETPATSREEVLVFQHRIWLDIRNSLLLGNRWGWRSLWPGVPPRKTFFVSAAAGALVASLPLSGHVPTMTLAAVGSVVGWDAPVVEMPWQVAASSGLLAHHVLTAISTLLQRFASQPEVTVGIRPLRQMWSSKARPALLAAPFLAVAAAWAVGWGLEQLGQEVAAWRWIGMAGGAVRALNLAVGPPLSRIRLRRWRSLKEAERDWEGKFAEVFTSKEGAPQLVDRMRTPCGAIVDVVDAPPKLMAAGLQGRAEMISAAYGDASTRIDVLGSPNLDAAGQPVPGTAHQLRARIVQWPEGAFPNLLDPDLDDVSRDLALESVMARAMDAIGVNRMVLVEASQVADLPAKIDPRLGELAEKRERRVRKQIEKLGEGHEEEVAELESSLEEPLESVGTSPFQGVWRWLRGAPKSPLVTPDDSPLAIWKTTWAMPGIPTPPWQTIQSEYLGIAAECSTVIDDESVEVDAVVERREGFLLIGDPLSDGARYTEESGIDLQSVRNVQAEIEWEKRWEQTLPQGAQPPTTRFEVTRDAELPQRFAREGLVLHEQLFATKTGLDAGETYIDPRGKDLEKGMRTSITGAQMVSMVGWPSEKEGPGSRHPHLFVVRWSTQPVPTTPQDVSPAEQAGPVSTSASAWVLAHQINSAFRAAGVKLPKPEVVDAEALTLPASSKHAWKVTIRLHGGTTLVDVRKKADAIRSQLTCPWMRIQSAGDGQVTLYIGDPGPGAKLRRGADVQVRRVDFDQAFVDSNITNLSGAVPELTKMEALESNPQVEVLDFDLPSGVDFAKVKGNREKLRSNLNVEFLDARRHGASSVRLFMAEHDPLPERVGIPFDNLPDTPAAFGVNALGEQTVFDPLENPHLLVLGGTGSGKSAAISTMLFDLIRRGFEPVIIDPTKGGRDFLFAKDWTIAPFAADVFQAASTMKALRGELDRRKALNGQYDVVNIDKLPEEARPRHIVVIVDEFTSLIGKSSVPSKSDDPAADHARLEAEAENDARAIVGNIVGRIAREARFVGIHLILGTQKLKQDTLNKMSGAEDIKVNLARMGLGNMTQGDRMSAFRNPLEADTIAEPRVGRGLFEPLTAPHPEIMQVWYEENATLKDHLLEEGVETPAAEMLLDPTDPRFVVTPLEDFVDVVEESVVDPEPIVEDIDLELGDLDLGSLLPDSDTAPAAPEPGSEVVDIQEPPEIDDPDAVGARSVRLSELYEGTAPWDLVEALQEMVESEPVAEVLVDVDGLDVESEVGDTYLDLIAEVTTGSGAHLRMVTADDEPAQSAADVALHDEADESGPFDEDGFDFGFDAPPVVRGGL